MSKRKGPPEDFYTVQQVAAALGRHPKTIRRAIDAEELKAHRFKRSIRISAADYRIYVASKRT
jgi:excisionase family DNA binding protein